MPLAMDNIRLQPDIAASMEDCGDLASGNRSIHETRRLLTAFHRVDSFTGGFLPGEMVFLRGYPQFVHFLECLVLVRGVGQMERDSVLIDGGNGANPYLMSNLARRFRCDADELTKRVHLSRAFTVHQMGHLIEHDLQTLVDRTGAGTLVVSSFPQLHLDDRIGWDESRSLCMRALAKLRQLSPGRVIILTDPGGSPSYHHRRFVGMVEGASHRVINVRFLGRRKLRIWDSDGNTMDFCPVPPHQWTLDDFKEG